MADNLIQNIEKGLGVKHVPVIDPNTQKPIENTRVSIEDAAVPAILAGLYKKTRSPEGAGELINAKDVDIFDLLYSDNQGGVVRSVADYAGTTETDAAEFMHEVAAVSRNHVVRELKNDTPNALINFFTSQRNNILKHLPPDLNMGEFLNDPTLDDRTNKMEGPMSAIVHAIEKIFSSSK